MYKTPLPFVILVASFLVPVVAGAQKLKWFNDYGGTTSAITEETHVDQQGNIYCTGSFQGTVDFDPGPGTYNLTSNAGLDAFLTKIDANGNLIFAIRDGATGSDFGHDVITDAAGNIYWVGERSTGFLFKKLTSGGTVIFNHVFGGSGGDIMQIALDSVGDLILGGSFTGTRDFDPASGVANLTSMGQSDMCLMKFTATGNYVWAKSFGSTSFDCITVLAIHPDNTIWVSGYYSSTFTTRDFDPGPGVVPLSGHGLYDMLLAQYDTNGNYMRAIGLGSSVNEFTLFILFDADSNLQIGGYFDGVINFNPTATVPGSVLSGNGPNDGFMARYDDSLRYISCYQIGGPGFDIIREAEYMNDSTLIIMGNWQDTVDFNPDTNFTTIRSTGAQSDMFIGKYDTSGFLLEIMTMGFPTLNESAEALDVTSAGEIVLAGQYVSVCNFNPLGVPEWHNRLGQSGAFVAKYNFNFNEYGGKVFLDVNNDSIFQPTEPLIANSVLSCQPGNLVAASDEFGNYHFLVDTLTYTAQTMLPAWFTPVPAQHTFSFPGFNAVDTSGSFALQVSSVAQDLQIYATPWVNVARRNETFNVTLNYRNFGTTSPSGTVWLQVDTALLDLQSSTPLPDTTSGDSIGWNFSTFSIFAQGTVELNYHTTLLNNAGDTVHLFASIEPLSPDATPIDNADTISLLVAAAHDPNMIVVSPDDSMSAVTQILDYTIHFQNTGNSYAQTVYIRDTLSPLLDLTTVEIVGSSFPVQFFIDQTGNSVFLFENIMLLDSNTNEPLSHGFVRYRVRPLPSFQQGDTIRNTAYIFFDFEEPVVTNTTKNYLAVLVPGFDEQAQGEINIYPNPAEDELTIERASSAACTISMIDVAGRLVSYSNFPAGESVIHLNTSTLNNGMYILCIEEEGKITTQRVAINH